MKRNGRLFSGTLLIAVLVVGGALTAIGLMPGSEDPIVSGGLPEAAAGLLDGSITDAVEQVVERSHPLRGPSLAALAAVRYLLFRDTLGDAVPGTDGYLFTREEFERHQEDDERLADRLNEIRMTAATLEIRGAKLVVLLLPSKARVLSSRLSGRWTALADHPRYEEALAALRDSGVLVVELGETLADTSGPQRFYARDTHWTPYGALAAARETALVLEKAGTLDRFERSQYTLEPVTTEAVPGDLMAFLPVGRLRGLLGLPEEQAVVYRAGADEPSEPIGLFDDLIIPVALVGTSFSRDARFGFEAALKTELGLDVLNVAAEGAGPFEPMRGYLAGTTITELPPSLVVWEIPERYLTLP